MDIWILLFNLFVYVFVQVVSKKFYNSDKASEAALQIPWTTDNNYAQKQIFI